MKKILVSFIILSILACQKEQIVTSKLKQSIGERNQLALVIEDSLWNSWIGDSIRKYIARPVPAMQKNEPMYDIVQYSPKIFNHKAKEYRNILDFRLQSVDTFHLKKNIYAFPQNYFTFQATTKDKITQLLSKYSDSIVSVLYQSELYEEIQYINSTNIQKDSLFRALIGASIHIPTYYHLSMYTETPFFWYQKNLSSGNVNLIVYEFPIDYIEENEAEIEDKLIQLKDTIGKNFIKGAKSFSYAKTDKKIQPIVTNFMRAGMPVYRIQGSWNMQNDIAYGPYLCYVYKDEYYQRYLFVEGFINDPYKLNRDNLLELEAIIHTINFFEE